MVRGFTLPCAPEDSDSGFCSQRFVSGTHPPDLQSLQVRIIKGTLWLKKRQQAGSNEVGIGLPVGKDAS